MDDDIDRSLIGEIDRCEQELGNAIQQAANHFCETDRHALAFQCVERFASYSLNDERKAHFRLVAGIIAEKAGNFRAAVGEYRKGLENPTSSLDTQYFLHNNIGYSLVQLGEFAEAETWCRKAVTIDSTRYNAFKNLGLALEGQGKYLEAAKSLERASLMSPNPRAKAHLEALLVAHPEVRAAFEPAEIVQEGVLFVTRPENPGALH